MGEDSTCLLHGFSYASAVPNDSKQGNAMHALGESISFGRFMTESLSWEKWSSFSSSSPHKKYVEEAERYAQPGSVAQKKAFFEAHYKRMAARKAAALLEQQNAATTNNVKVETEGDTDISGDDQKKEVILDVREECGVNGNKQLSTGVVEISKEGEIAIITEIKASGESPVKSISVSAPEISGTPFMEMPLLKTVELTPCAEGDKGVECTFLKTQGVMRLLNLHKAIENTGQYDYLIYIGLNNPFCETHELICQEPEILCKQNSVGSEVIPSVENMEKSGLSCLKSSIRRKTWNIPSTPAKPVTTPQFKKESYVTIQSTRKSNVDSTDRKRSSSTKSLRELINLVPFKEPDKELVFAAKKGSGSTRTPNEDYSSTPLRTPIVGTTKSVSRIPKTTPLTENGRTKAPIDPSAARGSKTTEPKWHLLSAVSKSEKAGNELRKLSCCFKARPLPDFYKERETSAIHQFKKTPAARPQTVVLGRSNSNKKQGTSSMPPPPPPPKFIGKKSACSKTLSKKKVANGSTILTRSLPGRTTHENKSPNIQH
ncbi:hypothetical protein OROMI_000407 [Orobanche minor]